MSCNFNLLHKRDISLLYIFLYTMFANSLTSEQEMDKSEQNPIRIFDNSELKRYRHSYSIMQPITILADKNIQSKRHHFLRRRKRNRAHFFTFYSITLLYV